MTLLRSFLFCFLLVALELCVFGQNPPHDDDQSWNDIQITKGLDNKHDLLFNGQVRLGREFHFPVEEQLGMALAYKINSHLTIAPGYSYVGQQPYPGRIVNQHRMVFTVTARAAWHDFTFTTRHQFERRFVVANRDSTVYRPRVMIEHPAQIGSFKFKPFIWDEVRYSSLKQVSGARLGWFRNRLALGINKQLNERFSTDIFYLRQDDSVSRPGNIHALGLSFRITLPARHS